VPGPHFEPTDTPAGIDGVATAVFEGEAVLFDESTAMVHRLGAIAAAVWLYCDGETTVDSMTDELSEAFDLQPAELTPVIEQALSRFADEGLLVGHPPPVRIPVDGQPTSADDGTDVLLPPPDG